LKVLLMRFFRLFIVLEVLAFVTGANSLSAADPSTTHSKANQTALSDGESAAASDKRPKLALIVSEFEYKTYETLPAFAKANFGDDFEIESALNSDEHFQELPGISILRDADVAILSLWRRTLPPEQLAVLKEYIAAGKPIVGFRAASHAFITRDGTTPEGRESWPTFDRDVLGCHYEGHHGNYAKEGFPPTWVWVIPDAQGNPLLAGISAGEFTAPSWLYKVQPLSEGAVPLMMGRVADRQPQEPVAWTYYTKDGGRVFYTSLGSPDDFELPQFRRLLRNAVYWAADKEIPNSPPK
jgi:type 1 glutamine amidotransferase